MILLCEACSSPALASMNVIGPVRLIHFVVSAMMAVVVLGLVAYFSIPLLFGVGWGGVRKARIDLFGWISHCLCRFLSLICSD